VRRDGEVIAVRGPGTFFGEMALLLDRPPERFGCCPDGHDD
jgi:CRP-like cAMP-binding protein